MADLGNVIKAEKMIKKHKSSPSCPGQLREIEKAGTSSFTHEFTSAKSLHPINLSDVRSYATGPMENKVLETCFTDNLATPSSSHLYPRKDTAKPKLQLHHSESEGQGPRLLKEYEMHQQRAARERKLLGGEAIHVHRSCAEFVKHGGLNQELSKKKHQTRGPGHLKDTDHHHRKEGQTEYTKQTLAPHQRSDKEARCLKCEAMEFPQQPNKRSGSLPSKPQNPHCLSGLPQGFQHRWDGKAGADSLADNFERALSTWNEELREAFCVRSRSLPVRERVRNRGTQTFVSFGNYSCHDQSSADATCRKQSDHTRPHQALFGNIRKTVFSTLENMHMKRMERTKAKSSKSLPPSQSVDPKQNDNSSAKMSTQDEKFVAADENCLREPDTCRGVNKCLNENTSMRRDSKANLNRKSNSIQGVSVSTAGCSRHDRIAASQESRPIAAGRLSRKTAVKSQQNFSENPDGRKCLLCAKDGSRQSRQTHLYGNRRVEMQKKYVGKYVASSPGDSKPPFFSDVTDESLFVPDELCEPLHQIFGILVLFVTLVILSFLLPRKLTHEDFDITDKMCKSRSCSRTIPSTVGSRISRFVDPKVDPCQNFYRFSCGRYEKETLLGFDDLYMDPARRSSLDTRARLHNLLIETSRERDIEPVKKAKLFYQTCWRQTLSNDSQSSAEIQSYFAEQFAECTRTSIWSFGRDATLECMLGRLALHSFDPLFAVSVDVDPGHRSKNILVFSPPQWARLGHPDLRHASATLDPEVVAFASEIQSRAAKGQSANSANSFEKFTLKRLSNMYPQLDWSEFLISFMKSSGVEITENEVFILQPPVYFEHILPFLARTPLSRVFQFVSYVVEFLFDQNHLDRQQCLMETRTLFHLAVGRLYIDNDIEPMVKAKVQKMSEKIKNSSQELVNEITWLPPAAKRVLKRRLSLIGARVAHSDLILDDAYLNDFYKDFYSVIPDKHPLNSVRARKAFTEANLRTLGKPVAKDYWPNAAVPLTSVDAMYVQKYDLFFLPAALLQSPVVGLDQPESLNYGGLGSIIGHELVHGFNEGFSLSESSFGEVELKFRRRRQCLVDQYSNFSSHGRSSSVPMQEILADIAGLRASYRAFQQESRDMGEREMVLEGLPYTGDQLFFISFAQLHCRKNGPNLEEMRREMSSHPPNELRVLLDMQNSEEFSRAFSCPRGSGMNREERCDLW